MRKKYYVHLVMSNFNKGDPKHHAELGIQIQDFDPNSTEPSSHSTEQ